jgi:TonB family protein
MSGRRARSMTAVTYIVLTAVGGCSDKESSQKMAQALQVRGPRPDEFPKVLNTELPFHYPAALYARRVQGNVTLRLYIDQNGQVHPDSTRVEESSGHLALDSAAMKGAQELRFVPAKLRGDPMPATVLFPVYFRHPEARALPGDTILNRPAIAP